MDGESALEGWGRSATLPVVDMEGEEQPPQDHWQAAMAENTDVLADTGLGITVDDWEPLGLDQEPLFWEAALDICPDPMPSSHPHGEEEPQALGRERPNVIGSNSSESRSSPLLQESLGDGLPQEILDALAKDSHWTPSFESCLSDSCLESLLGDLENLLGSEVTHEESPMPRKHDSHPGNLPRIGESPEESLLAGRSKEDSSAEPRQEEWGNSSLGSHPVEHQGVHAQEKPPTSADQRGLSQRVFFLVWPIQPRSKAHACKECGRCFPQSVDLQRHQRVHAPGQGGAPAACHPQRVWCQKPLRIVKAYKCEQCERTFTRASQLAGHRQSHRETGRSTTKRPSAARSPSCSTAMRATGATPAAECQQCGKAFRRLAMLTLHHAAHTGQKPYRCGECQKAFSHATTLRRHQWSHAGKLPYQCGTCGKAFCQHGRLRDHQRSHTGDRPHLCPHCTRSFSHARQLLRHQSSHSAGQLFRCAQCHEAFGRREHLERHQRSHIIEAPHQCSCCGERFVCGSTLHCHLASHSGQKPGLHAGRDVVGEHGARFRCGRCGESFCLRKHLAQHERIHARAQASVCPGCGKAFCHAPQLDHHLNTHCGVRLQEKAGLSSSLPHPQSSHLSEPPFIHAAEKSLKCTQCGLMFTHRSSLTQHQRSHPTRKHFPCAQCGKTFRQSCSLSRHLRVHSGEKPHTCHHCGKAFAQRANLSRHERTHTGEKPFLCDVCGRPFAVRAHLSQHRRIHTHEKPYHCPHCEKTFRSCPGLSRHSRRWHTDSSNTSRSLSGAAEPHKSGLVPQVS
ncbi:zinc finger protein 473 [Dipodomys spectabilis]|uniref:zinc finger protein 473 n=1 Tax=Dipodomys spectabilis TaxID=105255 RepID=UPI001C53A4A6|nr:zinc finger protein 473 [Dipodomys spectabilis]